MCEVGTRYLEKLALHLLSVVGRRHHRCLPGLVLSWTHRRGLFNRLLLQDTKYATGQLCCSAVAVGCMSWQGQCLLNLKLSGAFPYRHSYLWEVGAEGESFTSFHFPHTRYFFRCSKHCQVLGFHPTAWHWEVNRRAETWVSSWGLIQASRITCRFHAICLLAEHTQTLPKIPFPGKVYVLCVRLWHQKCAQQPKMPGATCQIAGFVTESLGAQLWEGVQGKQDTALCLLLLPGGLEPATANQAPAQMLL